MTNVPFCLILHMVLVSYVEVIKNGETISSCFQPFQKNENYGTITSANEQITLVIFHNLIMDMVLPKVVPIKGNKVTKMSMNLIDGFDCFYSTDDHDPKTVYVCFTLVDIPKILPIRILSGLQEYESNATNELLSSHVGQILDSFHEELVEYRNQTLNSSGNGQSSNGNGQNTISDIGDATEDQIKDVIQIMNDNIDKFLERQERVSLLVDKTSQLNSSSNKFRRKAVNIKEIMWWQKVKNITLLTFTIILFVSAAFMFFYLW
ncbi:CLL_collapsed_G0036200.mRNA.1.CDS.1 [Saccharomyces cerevisiae]|nr:CLL_HP2_G0031060.mRNA.1.CDS.1 [Saccharomyces cerevisiae]CAI6585624.1 CLL_HP2_G0031060.mRNA.1.CDS.1 [Saccharomyces cerevisiae]CAI6693143.1 CLL_HP1_G0035790.mRNA.1.CDS.1 [Saccharomyces cerevisiae]CAI7406536.1 CLL_collapsed_G0036200.mRNA.1.CDS.1 [Saccharomyces cerevisiae]